MRSERCSAWAMSSSSSTTRTRGARAKSFIVACVARGAKAMVRLPGRFHVPDVEVALDGPARQTRLRGPIVDRLRVGAPRRTRAPATTAALLARTAGAPAAHAAPADPATGAA